MLLTHFIVATYRSCGGWTNGGQIAGEIHNPRKSFNFAIMIVMVLTLAFSLLPLSIAACAYKDHLEDVSIFTLPLLYRYFTLLRVLIQYINWVLGNHSAANRRDLVASANGIRCYVFCIG